MNHGVLQGFSSVPRNTEQQKVYGAGIVTNPRHMPISSVQTQAIKYKNASNGVTSLSVAAPADLTRLQVVSSAQVNILTVSGSGFVTHIILPGYRNAASTPILTIDVDGVSYIITTTALTVQRLVIGSVLVGDPEAASTATFASSLAKGFAGIGSPNDSGHLAKAGKTAVLNNSTLANYILPSVAQILNYALPRIRFEKYLAVYIESPGFSTYDQFDDSAYVGYVLD